MQVLDKPPFTHGELMGKWLIIAVSLLLAWFLAPIAANLVRRMGKGWGKWSDSWTEEEKKDVNGS